jgi:Fe-S-cluster containining protein
VSEPPDCQACAACCFGPGERYVPVTGADHARLTPDEQARFAVFFGIRCFMRMHEGHCAALVARDGKWTCTVYERRPQQCRDYERGGPACEHDLATRGPVKPG